MSVAKFYVYALIDPRDGQPFYIGKGQGKRAWSHRPRGRNLARVERIADIRAAGLMHSVRIVADFQREEQALRLERRLIARLSGLTNIADGGAVQDAAVRERLIFQKQLRVGCLILRHLPESHPAVQLVIRWAKTHL